MPFATYDAAIDFNADGDFEDAYENISTDIKSVWFHRGKDPELERGETGTARITVKDTTGKYIPQNTSSTIVATYGGIYPARAVRVRATYTSTYDLFNGYLDDVNPEPEKETIEAMLPCVDGFDQLARAKITLPIIQSGYSGGASGIIVAALNAAGWPAAKRTIDAGQNDAYAAVFAEQESALGFLQKPEASEFGLMYIDRNGYFNWEDRYFRLSATRATTRQCTITDSEFVRIRPANSLKSVRNKIVVSAVPKAIDASESDIWTLPEKASSSNSPTIAAGETKTYWAKFAASGGDANIAGSVQEVVSGDYAGDSLQGWVSGDRTSWLSLSSTIYAASAKVQVKNSGSQALFLSQLRVRGKPYRDLAKVQIVQEDTSSQSVYQVREQETSLPYYVDANMMDGLSAHQLAQKKNPIPAFVVELINGNDNLLIQILARDVSDRVNIQSTAWNISGDYYIDAVEHEIADAGKVHKAWWWVSRADDQEYWILDKSKLFGSGDPVARLAY